MNKSITLYFNTGFNAINFPANPEMLMLFDHKDYPAMDLVQENFLSSIRIKAFEDEIIDADYLQIGNAYYSIESYIMSSSDIVTFSISQNPILSVGGIDELEYITGEVARSTAIDFIDMDFDNYTIIDELLSYSERRPNLKLTAFGKDYDIDSAVGYEKKWYGNDTKWYEDNGDNYLLPIMTSMYDDEVPEKPDMSEIDDLLASEGASIWATLVTSWISRRQFETTIRLVGHDIAHVTDLAYTMPAVSMYSGHKIYDAALVMYGFGRDNFILDSYTIPRDFVDYEINGGHITQLIGKSNRAIISLGSKYEKVLDVTQYENLNPIIREIIANQVIEVSIESVATGASNTVPFSELSSDTVGGSAEAKQIYIDMIADPSPSGCPYYKMVVKDRYGTTGTTDGNVIDIMLGSIRGASWMNNPLTFSGYGRTRDDLLITNSNVLRQTMQRNVEMYQDSIHSINGGGRVINTLTLGLVKGYEANANLSNARSNNVYDLVQHYDGNNLDEIAWRANQRMSNARSSNTGLAIGFLSNIASNYNRHSQEKGVIDAEQDMNLFNNLAQTTAEHRQNNITHAAIGLDMKFPISDNGQLLYGNGILINIKSMSKRDLTRYIRVLQQFGIACTGKMNRVLVSRLNNEPYHYIQAVGVSVKYADDALRKHKINKRLLSAISAMFEVGFRIWYEKPEDNSYQKMYLKEVQ